MSIGVSLTLSDCDSKAQKEVKQQADAIEESANAQPNLMEARALSAPNQNAVDAKAKAVRDKGEKTNGHLDTVAEKLDDVLKK